MCDDWVLEHIARYRASGVLVDSNLLLLYAIGMCDPALIEQFKRTQMFTEEDYALLAYFLAQFQKTVTTSGVLAEVNSLGNQLKDQLKQRFLEVLKQQISVLDERPVESKMASFHQVFAKCGLTDSAIAVVAESGVLVLTGDFRLYGLLNQLGIACINFTHIRFKET